MRCAKCGVEIVKKCIKCSAREKVWGEEGNIALIKMSKRSDDIPVKEIVDIFERYYIGRSKERSDKANTLRTTLKLLGYKGKIIGRIHENKQDYFSYRKRENQTARRTKLAKDHCELCGEENDLFMHHIFPLSLGGTTSDENVITLCNACHRKVHKKLSKLIGREKIIELLSPYADELNKLARTTVIRSDPSQ